MGGLKLKHIVDLLADLGNAIKVSDDEKRNIFMIAETFTSLVELADEIEVEEEGNKLKLEQLKSSLKDLKFILKSRADNRVYEYDFE